MYVMTVLVQSITKDAFNPCLPENGQIFCLKKKKKIEAI